MRARLTFPRAATGIASLLALGACVVGACVPDFSFGGGGGQTTASGDGDGDGGASGEGGRRRPDGGGGEGGGRRPTTVGGFATSSGDSTGSSSGATVSASSGEGGVGTPSASSGATASSSTGLMGTPGVPCWNGSDGEVVVCSGGESACCADVQYYEFDECGAPGDCGGFAWELGCNESADCGSQLCCVTTDGDGGLAWIGCSASCNEFEACDPSVGCLDGRTCTPIPQLQDDTHPEYDAYGYCN